MASPTIQPVTSRRDLKRFIDLPYQLYRDNPYWIPPLRQEVASTLNPKKNPFFEHGDMQLYLALDTQGTAIGRIAAIRNGMHLQTHEDGVGFFGFFESPDDPEVAHALLDTAASWVQDQDLQILRGPANPSLNDTAGLLTDGFDRRPYLLMPYNFSYYEDLLTGYGMERVMTMYAYFVHEKYLDARKLRRGVQLVQRRNPSLSVRTLDMDRYEEEAAMLLDIYNDAWSDNWGHVPMTDAEFDRLAADLKQIVDPNLVVFVEDAGEPVAFAISLPNMNQAFKHVPDGRLFPLGLFKLLAAAKFGINELRMPLMGVRKAYQGKGLDALVILNTIDYGLEEGYTACEMSWVLAHNKALTNALDTMGGVVDKTYGLFERTLPGA